MTGDLVRSGDSPRRPPLSEVAEILACGDRSWGGLVDVPFDACRGGYTNAMSAPLEFALPVTPANLRYARNAELYLLDRAEPYERGIFRARGASGRHEEVRHVYTLVQTRPDDGWRQTIGKVPVQVTDRESGERVFAALPDVRSINWGSRAPWKLITNTLEEQATEVGADRIEIHPTIHLGPELAVQRGMSYRLGLVELGYTATPESSFYFASQHLLKGSWSVAQLAFHSSHTEVGEDKVCRPMTSVLWSGYDIEAQARYASLLSDWAGVDLEYIDLSGDPSDRGQARFELRADTSAEQRQAVERIAAVPMKTIASSHIRVSGDGPTPLGYLSLSLIVTYGEWTATKLLGDQKNAVRTVV